ncbi:DUF5011 domain-containing protein [Carnobacterium divergens]|nr:DUF5011 domain-containing protein [Carnobacterium divergens]
MMNVKKIVLFFLLAFSLFSLSIVFAVEEEPDLSNKKQVWELSPEIDSAKGVFKGSAIDVNAENSYDLSGTKSSNDLNSLTFSENIDYASNGDAIVIGTTSVDEIQGTPILDENNEPYPFAANKISTIGFVARINQETKKIVWIKSVKETGYVAAANRGTQYTYLAKADDGSFIVAGAQTGVAPTGGSYPIVKKIDENGKVQSNLKLSKILSYDMKYSKALAAKEVNRNGEMYMQVIVALRYEDKILSVFIDKHNQPTAVETIDAIGYKEDPNQAFRGSFVNEDNFFLMTVILNHQLYAVKIENGTGKSEFIQLSPETIFQKQDPISNYVVPSDQPGIHYFIAVQKTKMVLSKYDAIANQVRETKVFETGNSNLNTFKYLAGKGLVIGGDSTGNDEIVPTILSKKTSFYTLLDEQFKPKEHRFLETKQQSSLLTFVSLRTENGDEKIEAFIRYEGIQPDNYIRDIQYPEPTATTAVKDTATLLIQFGISDAPLLTTGLPLLAKLATEINPMENVSAKDSNDKELTNTIVHSDYSNALGVERVYYQSKLTNTLKTTGYREIQKINPYKEFTLPTDRTYQVGDQFEVPATESTAFKGIDEKNRLNYLITAVNEKEIGVQVTIYREDGMKKSATVQHDFVVQRNNPLAIYGEDIVVERGDYQDLADIIPLFNAEAKDQKTGKDRTKELSFSSSDLHLQKSGKYQVRVGIEGIIYTEFLVYVEDTKPPVLESLTEITYQKGTVIEEEQFFQDIQLKVNEEADTFSNFDTSMLASAGEYLIELVSIDESANFTFHYVTLKVKNAPEIYGDTQLIVEGTDYDPLLQEVTAKDDDNQELTGRLTVIENNVNPAKLGVYQVTYQVTDLNGFSTTKQIYVIVYNDDDYGNLQKGLPVINFTKGLESIKVEQFSGPLELASIFGIEGFDKIEGNLTKSVYITLNNQVVTTFTPNKLGEYQLHVNLKNAKGVAALEKIITLTVYKEDSPNTGVEGELVLQKLPGHFYFETTKIPSNTATIKLDKQAKNQQGEPLYSNAFTEGFKIRIKDQRSVSKEHSKGWQLSVSLDFMNTHHKSIRPKGAKLILQAREAEIFHSNEENESLSEFSPYETVEVSNDLTETLVSTSKEGNLSKQVAIPFDSIKIATPSNQVYQGIYTGEVKWRLIAGP